MQLMTLRSSRKNTSYLVAHPTNRKWVSSSYQWIHQPSPTEIAGVN